MTIAIGDRIPNLQLFEKAADGPAGVMSDDIFAGRRVALFGVPGAFTRTCSSKHLPGFVANALAIKSKGIDEIVCLSVNDAWVMDAWGDAHGATGLIRMVGDGDLAFTRFAGLEVDMSAKGYGPRCKRFSLLADDAVVTHLHFEAPGDFGATSAETLMKDL